MKNIGFTSLLAFLLVFASCSTSVEKKQERKINASYDIIYDSSNEYPTSNHRTFTIGVDSMLTIEQIVSISDSIVQNSIGQKKALDIKFRILNTTSGYKYKSYSELYAETKMDSMRYETAIVYVPKQEKITPTAPIVNETPTETNQSVSVNYNIIGTWINEYGSYNMYKKDGVYYLENKYIDGSGNTEKLSTRKKNGQLIFNVEGDNTEYFIIRQDGLYIYDSFGDLGAVYKNRF